MMDTKAAQVNKRQSVTAVVKFTFCCCMPLYKGYMFLRFVRNVCLKPNIKIRGTISNRLNKRENYIKYERYEFNSRDNRKCFIIQV